MAQSATTSKFAWFSRWHPKTRRAFVVIAFACAIASLPVSLLSAYRSFTIPIPQSVNVFKEMSKYQRAEYFGRNFLLYALTGTNTQSIEDAIGSMASLHPPAINLNPRAMTVLSIDPYDVEWIYAYEDTEWVITYSVSFTTPSKTAIDRQLFVVTSVQHSSGAFQAISWPRITDVPRTPIQVGEFYTVGVDPHGALGSRLSEFISAYYTGSSMDYKGAPLSNFISEKFDGGPIPNTPFSSATVLAAYGAPGAINYAKAEPGESAEIMVTFVANMTPTTFLTMQVPLRVTLSKNKQWLVDEIETATQFGPVAPRE